MNIRALLPEEMKARLDSGVCISCGQPFTSDNVFTEAGRREAQISQTCEKCFDALFDGEEEDEADHTWSLQSATFAHPEVAVCVKCGAQEGMPEEYQPCGGQ
ncbi:MAG: hypothetical protein EPN70_03360 [Paraburkholderia sp.]|uniref:hypothetical protein n=1 Tax=Paraburkholderia sp. TaxID=1926495 RepID=UPI00121C5933|nr:hypothetical protein [Paraburkholderia sp.]TAM07223.1 MAG: hypothetical protein EPN70_03360 [Paraburkholderia sp.]TAM32639.1 MAG: hypothetical protein EPN59_01700 [Paraburkholderia sp.]